MQAQTKEIVVRRSQEMPIPKWHIKIYENEWLANNDRWHLIATLVCIGTQFWAFLLSSFTRPLKWHKIQSETNKFNEKSWTKSSPIKALKPNRRSETWTWHKNQYTFTQIEINIIRRKTELVLSLTNIIYHQYDTANKYAKRTE